MRFLRLLQRFLAWYGVNPSELRRVVLQYPPHVVAKTGQDLEHAVDVMSKITGDVGSCLRPQEILVLECWIRQRG